MAAIEVTVISLGSRLEVPFSSDQAAEGVTVADVVTHEGVSYDDSQTINVNQQTATLDTALSDGDVVGFATPAAKHGNS